MFAGEEIDDEYFKPHPHPHHDPKPKQMGVESGKLSSYKVQNIFTMNWKKCKQKLTLKVLVATVDALGHFETG